MLVRVAGGPLSDEEANGVHSQHTNSSGVQSFRLDVGLVKPMFRIVKKCIQKERKSTMAFTDWYPTARLISVPSEPTRIMVG